MYYFSIPNAIKSPLRVFRVLIILGMECSHGLEGLSQPPLRWSLSPRRKRGLEQSEGGATALSQGPVPHLEITIFPTRGCSTQPVLTSSGAWSRLGEQARPEPGKLCCPGLAWWPEAVTSFYLSNGDNNTYLIILLRTYRIPSTPNGNRMAIVILCGPWIHRSLVLSQIHVTGPHPPQP